MKSAQAFRDAFHLGRPPLVTLAAVALLAGVYLLTGPAASPVWLQRFGANSHASVVELGETWRLFAANLLHISPLHLAVNAFVLFNAGGVAENVFRRGDYLLLLLATMLGTTAFSAGFSNLVTAGASGMVFGVLAAAAAFGIRHRKLLSARYKRFFLWSLLPYTGLLMYIGLLSHGIDQWGHFGGLATGWVLGSLLPSRILAPPRRGDAALATGFACLLCALVAGLPMLLGPPVIPEAARTLAGTQLQLPEAWLPERDYLDAPAYGNGVGVLVGARMRAARTGELGEEVRELVERDLGSLVESGTLAAVRYGEPFVTSVGGSAAAALEVTLLSSTGPFRSWCLFARHGGYDLRLTLTARLESFAGYAPRFARIAEGLQWPVEPTSP